MKVQHSSTACVTTSQQPFRCNAGDVGLHYAPWAKDKDLEAIDDCEGTACRHVLPMVLRIPAEAGEPSVAGCPGRN